MLLYRKKIDGWDTFTNEQVSGVFPYLAADVNPDENEWADITSITNWHLYGSKLGKDYKWWRDKIKELVNTLGSGDVDAGFVLCTADEKLILTEHKIGSHANRVATVGFINAVNLGLQYNGRASAVRNTRLGIAHGLVHNYLPDDAKTLFDSSWSAAHKVSVSYVFFGIEGTLIGDPVGMSDWIYGTAGQEFAGIGLLQKPWTPENGLTMQQLCDAAWDVIHNGNY